MTWMMLIPAARIVIRPSGVTDTALSSPRNSTFGLTLAGASVARMKFSAILPTSRREGYSTVIAVGTRFSGSNSAAAAITSSQSSFASIAAAVALLAFVVAVLAAVVAACALCAALSAVCAAEFAALVASVAFFVADFIPSTTDWIYSSDTLTLLLNISTPIVHSPLNEVHSGSSDIFFFIISL